MADLISIPTPKTYKQKELTDHERIAMVGMLLGMACNGKLPHGSFALVAAKFGVAPRTASRLWDCCPQSQQTGMVNMKEALSKRHSRGRKRLWDRAAIDEALTEAPLFNRMTIRDLAEEIDLPKTTVQRLTIEGECIRRKRVYLKPKLTEEHKVWRMEYCLAQEDTEHAGYFSSQYNKVHVDEKWFHMMKDGNCFLLGKNEPDPYLHCTHKSYIGKVMFLSAVARPRRLPDGTFFDGKIGIWPFGKVVLAKRSSKNRPAGTPEWQNETCDADKYRQYLICNVLPAIVERFPSSYTFGRKGVVIQQDGAGGHIKEGDEEFQEAVEYLGMNCRLETQPAQSPDLNINDLSFFHSIASLTKKHKPKTMLELIALVQQKYEEYPPDKLNRMWLTHQAVMNEILECNGDNDYKLPHLKKSQLERQGRLPVTLRLSTKHAHTTRLTRSANSDLTSEESS